MIPATQTPMLSITPLPSVYFESRIGEPSGGAIRGPGGYKKGGAKKGGAKKGGAKKGGAKKGGAKKGGAKKKGFNGNGGTKR